MYETAQTYLSTFSLTDTDYVCSLDWQYHCTIVSSAAGWLLRILSSIVSIRCHHDLGLPIKPSTLSCVLSSIFSLVLFAALSVMATVLSVFGLHTLFFMSFFFLDSLCFITNVTIDDQYGDAVTGSRPTYSPSNTWISGVGCPTSGALIARPCNASGGTWHNGTDVSGGAPKAPLSFTIKFNGTINRFYSSGLTLNSCIFLGLAYFIGREADIRYGFNL